MSHPTKSEDFRSDAFVERLKARHPKALEAVVRAYTGHLVRAALGMGFHKDSAHDLAQEVWATFVDIVHKFEGRSHIRTLLFGILYNKAHEARRQKRRFSDHDSIDDLIEKKFSENGTVWLQPPVDPERFTLAAETFEIINECLDRLPTAQRAAFFLKEMREATTAEIRNILDVSDTNLRVMLFRARNRLRECIEGKA